MMTGIVGLPLTLEVSPYRPNGTESVAAVLLAQDAILYTVRGVLIPMKCVPSQYPAVCQLVPLPVREADPLAIETVPVAGYTVA
jgi:hypothetical protein